MREPEAHPDRIILEGLSFFGYHGVYGEERQLGQWFKVDLHVYLDLSVPGRSDDLDDTVSYSELHRLAKAVVEGAPSNLLESVATVIAEKVLDSPKVEAVRVRVEKPSPPIAGALLTGAAVEIYRERTGQR